MKSVRVRISGCVQGVWYRAWTERTATAHGLDGWVRNCPDGAVEAMFSGPATEVDAMIEACREGPPAARVTDMEINPAEAPDEPGFSVLPSE